MTFRYTLSLGTPVPADKPRVPLTAAHARLISRAARGFLETPELAQDFTEGERVQLEQIVYRLRSFAARELGDAA